MDWNNLLAIALEALLPLVFSVVGILLLRWLKKKGVKDEYVSLIEDGWSLLRTCVLSVNQTFVEDLKASNGGKLTDAQKAEARQQCINNFKSLASDALLLAIQAAYGSVDDWLGIALEAEVGLSKTTFPSDVIEDEAV